MISLVRTQADWLPLRATPPISALQAFERAASHLSFRLASMELAVSPSAVSHQIRGLEHYFGVQLFVRNGRGVTLTEEGERFFADVREGLGQLDRASRGLLRRSRGDRDEVRLRVSPLLAHLLVFARLPELERRYPQWKVSLDIGAPPNAAEPEDVLATLRVGRAGLRDAHLRPLLEIWQTPVGARGASLGDLADPENLLRQRLIHSREDPHAWRHWLSGFGALAEGVREIWVDTAAAAVEAAERGLGVALGPYPLVEARAGRLQIAACARSQAPETIYLACRSERREDRRILALGRWLEELFKAFDPRVGDFATAVEAS